MMLGIILYHSLRQISHLNPELVDMTSLAGQCALGIPCFCVLRLELQTGCHNHSSFVAGP